VYREQTATAVRLTSTLSSRVKQIQRRVRKVKVESALIAWAISDRGAVDARLVSGCYSHASVCDDEVVGGWV
jgi:hypothetical protein